MTWMQGTFKEPRLMLTANIFSLTKAEMSISGKYHQRILKKKKN